MRKATCAHCGRIFTLGGWVSTHAGATVYATARGEVALCSSECDQARAEEAVAA